MRYLLLLSLFTFCFSDVYSQNLIFEDENLKSMLVNENCVNYDGNFSYEDDADTNDDLEISIEEAMLIHDLRVTDTSSDYDITSINDVQLFPNLQN